VSPKDLLKLVRKFYRILRRLFYLSLCRQARGISKLCYLIFSVPNKIVSCEVNTKIFSTVLSWFFFPAWVSAAHRVDWLDLDFALLNCLLPYLRGENYFVCKYRFLMPYVFDYSKKSVFFFLSIHFCFIPQSFLFMLGLYSHYKHAHHFAFEAVWVFISSLWEIFSWDKYFVVIITSIILFNIDCKRSIRLLFMSCKSVTTKYFIANYVKYL